MNNHTGARMTDGAYIELLHLMTRAVVDLSRDEFINVEFLLTARNVLEDVLVARRHLMKGDN